MVTYMDIPISHFQGEGAFKIDAFADLLAALAQHGIVENHQLDPPTASKTDTAGVTKKSR